MAKQRISTLFVSLWQSRAMIFCTILRNLACCVSPGTCKNSGGDPTWRKHLPKNFQLTWVCFTCQSAEKKTFLSPKSSPCTFSVTMQLTDLVDDLLQNMSKQQLRSSKLGFSPTYRRGGFLQHYCWWLKRDVTSAYILYIPKMPYIPKCWQFSSAQIVPPQKKKRTDFQTPELPPSISIPLFSIFFHSDFHPKKKTSTVSPNHHLGLPSPANGTGIPCPLKSLGTGKASALMAGLSMDNDTIGPGDSGVHFPQKVGVSSQWPAFGCF